VRTEKAGTFPTLLAGKLKCGMSYNGKISIEAAVASQGGAMEADTISKHGRILKSHTSRVNIAQTG